MDILRKIEDDNVGYLRWKMNSTGLPEDPYYCDYSLLRFALCRERREVAKFLINNECQVNPTKKNPSNTPLHIAISKTDVEIIDMLLDRGASIEVCNRHGETPLHYAVKTRNNEIIDMIVDKLFRASRESCSSFDLTPLHIAVFKNDLHKVKCLFRSKMNTRELLSAQFYKKNVGPNDSTDKIQWSGYTALHFAIELERIGIVKTLLDFGADVDSRSANGLTALHLAAQKSKQLVHMILKKRKSKKRKHPDEKSNKCVDINSIDCFGNTPLQFAAKKKKLDIVNLLIEKGADICVRNNDGSTLLHIAVKTGDNEVVDSILMILKEHNTKVLEDNSPDANANLFQVNSTDCLGNTALHYAAEGGSARSVGMLLALDADVSLKNLEGQTPIHLALRKYWTDVIRLLSAFDQSNREKTNPTDTMGYSHFHAACLRGDIANIKSFLNNGVDVNETVSVESRKCPGYTPMHYAVENMSNAAVELLIEHNANADVSDATGQTPLHLAAEKVNLTATKLLLKCSCNPNAQTELGITPLHLAVRSRSMLLVELLLEYGADVELRDNKGISALHSDYSTDDDIVTLLMKRAIDLNFVDRKGESLLYKAIDRGNAEQINILLDRNVEVNTSEYEQNLTPLHLATREKNISLVNTLLRRGARVSARTKSGRTPLHELTAKSHSDEFENLSRIENYSTIITSLLNYSSDLEGRTAFGKTPLHYAIATRNVNAAIALLQQGADINAVDSVGKTPLMLAALCTQQFYTSRNFLRDHVYKMRMIEFYISQDNEISCLRMWGLTQPDDSFRRKCFQELKKLKRTEINSDCSLYDVLSKHARYLAHLIENATFRKIVSSKQLDVDFPMFNFFVRVQFRKGLTERIKQSAERFFAERGLPDLCSEKIIGYLPLESLVALIEATGHGIPGFSDLNLK